MRKTWESSGLFGNDRRVISESLVVEAENAEAAIRFAVSRSSVLSLESGVLVEAVQIDWDTALAKDAKYDGKPMNDNHTPTSAKREAGSGCRMSGYRKSLQSSCRYSSLGAES